MRYAIIAIAIAVTLIAGAASAQGSNEKYCAQMKGDPGSSVNCTYKTMAQCQETVKGDMGTCIENPALKGKM